MNITDKFEKRTRILLRDLTLKEFNRIIHDEGYIEFFEDQSTFLELSSGILRYGQDEDLKLTVGSIKNSLELRNAELKILELFRNYTSSIISRDELKESCIDLINSEDIITAVVAITCALTSLQDIDIKKEHLIEIITKLLRLIDYKIKPSMILGYTFCCDIIDLIASIREYYFNLKLDDCFNDDINAAFKNTIDKLHRFEDEVLKFKHIETDIKPEQLGLLDITKLGK